MTTVRFAHVEPLPGRQPYGRFRVSRFLVVLADDADRRVLPIWLQGGPGRDSLWRILARSRGTGSEAAEAIDQVPPEERTTAEDLAYQMLQAAGVIVTGVDLVELGPDVTAARIELAGPGGARHVTADIGYSLFARGHGGRPGPGGRRGDRPAGRAGARR